MVDFTKPIQVQGGVQAVYVGRCPNTEYPHVVSAVSKMGGRWYIMMVDDLGRRQDGGFHIINTPAPENVPEEW